MVEAPDKILCIMAHPDDAEIWCGGTLGIHSKASVCSILVESDDNIRRVEALSSARVLGVEVNVVPQITSKRCFEFITKFRPEIVISHNPNDTHPDHRRISNSVMSSIFDSFISTGFPKKLYSCDTYNSLLITGHFEGTRIINIESTYDLKVKAIAEHKSQPVEEYIRMVDAQAISWGRKIGCLRAEAFIPIPVVGIIPGFLNL